MAPAIQNQAPSDPTSIAEKAQNYGSGPEHEKRIKGLNAAWAAHRRFLQLYPFRESPEKIDELMPDDLYNPGSGANYFFLWPERRLRSLGGIAVGSAQVYSNAVNCIDELKALLRIAVDDSKGLSQKVDAPWERIKGFGGDKQIAKKIIASYDPDQTLSIFKTDSLERFAAKLGIDRDARATAKYGKPYADLSVGEKWQLLTTALIDVKQRDPVMSGWDNTYFMYFLHDTIPWERVPWGRTAQPPQPFDAPARLGLLFEPKNEQEVVLLFAKFHRDLGFPFILSVQQAYPDATVLDHQKQPKRIEFELAASHFQAHGHDPNMCDFLVCWDNDLEDGQINGVEVISLRDNLRDLGVL